MTDFSHVRQVAMGGDARAARGQRVDDLWTIGRHRGKKLTVQRERTCLRRAQNTRNHLLGVNFDRDMIT